MQIPLTQLGLQTAKKSFNYYFDTSGYDIEVLAMPYSIDDEGEFYHQNTKAWSSYTPVIFAHGLFNGYDGKPLGFSWFDRETIDGRVFRIKFDRDVLTDSQIEFFKDGVKKGTVTCSLSSLVNSKVEKSANGAINSMVIAELSLMDSRLVPTIKPVNKNAVALKGKVTLGHYLTQLTKAKIQQKTGENTMFESLLNLVKRGTPITPSELQNAISDVGQLPDKVSIGGDDLKTTIKGMIEESTRQIETAMNEKFNKLIADQEAKSKEANDASFIKSCATDLSTMLGKSQITAETARSVTEQITVLKELPQDIRDKSWQVIKSSLESVPKSSSGTALDNGNKEDNSSSSNNQDVDAGLAFIKSIANKEGLGDLAKAIDNVNTKK